MLRSTICHFQTILPVSGSCTLCKHLSLRHFLIAIKQKASEARTVWLSFSFAVRCLLVIYNMCVHFVFHILRCDTKESSVGLKPISALIIIRNCVCVCVEGIKKNLPKERHHCWAPNKFAKWKGLPKIIDYSTENSGKRFRNMQHTFKWMCFIDFP